MSKDFENNQDDRTVLVNHQGQLPTHEPLTDFAVPARYEALDSRMVHKPVDHAQLPSHTGINPILAAAMPLLSAIIRIKAAQSKQRDLTALKEELTAHLKSFETRVFSEGVDPQEIRTTGYMLCTVADEAVTTTQWSNAGGWSAISLLSSFHNETSGGVTFFELLQDMTRVPMKHLPTLELVYVCLALGFNGKYRVQDHGSSDLETLRDGLYRQIRHLRGDPPRDLSPHWTGLVGKRRGLVRVMLLWFVAAFTAAGLVAMYSGFAYVLGEKRESVLQRYLPTGPGPIEAHSNPGNVQ